MRKLMLTILLLVAGCSGQVSNVGVNAPAGQSIVYPISAEEADSVLSQAMLATFPDSPISTIALPGKGYSATIRFALDSHQISAIAVPAIGRGPNGTTLSGYAFEVRHAGTMPITAGNRSATLFAAINQRATAIRAPVPAAN